MNEDSVTQDLTDNFSVPIETATLGVMQRSKDTGNHMIRTMMIANFAPPMPDHIFITMSEDILYTPIGERT